MDQAKASFPDAHLDGPTMARLALSGHQILGYDTVMPVFSVTQEAAALGCVVDWGHRTMMPTVRSHPFAEVDDLSIPGGWMEEPSIQVVLDALHRLRLAVGDRVAVVGKVMGPWSLSYHMMGMEEFLISTILDPDRARQSLNALKAVTVEFANAQLRAGADIICLADHVTGGVVSPHVYRDMVLPLHQQITSEIGGPTVLHCCGNTTDRLRYFAESGIDCYHFESQVKVEDAVAAATGRITLMGNINNPQILLEGSPEEVSEACQGAIRGGVHILAPECAVPLTTPVDNLRVLVDVAEGLL